MSWRPASHGHIQKCAIVKIDIDFRGRLACSYRGDYRSKCHEKLGRECIRFPRSSQLTLHDCNRFLL